jgi:hydroxymethylglutaryl-CoA reductase
MATRDLEDIFKGFSKLDRDERLEALMDSGLLQPDDIQYLKTGGLKDVTLGEKFIENVIGYFQVPLGVATNFNIDNKDYIIPMAVEETSIVAAASKTAKWVREHGTIETAVLGRDIIGQIQCARIHDPKAFVAKILAQKNYLMEHANREVAFGLVRRGGGVTDIQVRTLPRPDGAVMGVVHVHMNPCDAMGAN